MWLVSFSDSLARACMPIISLLGNDCFQVSTYLSVINFDISHLWKIMMGGELLPYPTSLRSIARIWSDFLRTAEDSMKVFFLALRIGIHVGDNCGECLMMQFFFHLMETTMILINSIVTADHIYLTVECNQNLWRENLWTLWAYIGL